MLDTPIEFLKGVGPQKSELLKKYLNIFQFGDLLSFYPFRYVDRTRVYKVNEINEDMPYVQLVVKLKNVKMLGEKRAKRLLAEVQDETGKIDLVWFQGIKWINDKIRIGQDYIIFGKPSSFNGRLNITHPDLDEATPENLVLNSILQPVYNTTEKLKTVSLDSRGISRLQKTLVHTLRGTITETLPHYLIEQHSLMPREQALYYIHFPKNAETLLQAQRRLKYEELFYNQLRLVNLKLINKQRFKGLPFEAVGEHFNNFYNNYLPFPLTGAQKRVIKEIRNDIGSGKQMNRLLQGDVGSGKTIVALLCMLLAADNNYQACLMAPTEILAKQHFASLSDYLKDMPVAVGLLTGSTKSKERTILFERLQSGELNFLVGTHALLEDDVMFKNLGLVIIDEQHRFGVAQRAKLWKKNTSPPHVLVMTATPIPRTLAMTLYGDLDVSVIDELPPGRKPIKTVHRYDDHRLSVFGFMKEQIAEGRQIYVVYPLIQESEKMDYKDLMDGYESITRAFPQPQYQVSIVHGQMKADAKDHEMDRFVKGETQIMVATTVIEVGVNVPNASVMVIESAERFGLSQLHQLRGRVGRGADQSYCILMTSHKLSSESKLRIETMVKSNDGFELAEVDLKMRGPGDLEGTRQSGVLDLKIADLAKDSKILQVAREDAIAILTEDPELNNPKNSVISQQVRLLARKSGNWGIIS